MQPNLLNQYWDRIEPVLRERYPKVPPQLWRSVRGEYDGVVRLIREAYAMGRADIILEGEVRDLLNRLCWELEADAEART